MSVPVPRVYLDPTIYTDQSTKGKLRPTAQSKQPVPPPQTSCPLGSSSMPANALLALLPLAATLICSSPGAECLSLHTVITGSPHTPDSPSWLAGWSCRTASLSVSSTLAALSSSPCPLHPKCFPRHQGSPTSLYTKVPLQSRHPWGSLAGCTWLWALSHLPLAGLVLQLGVYHISEEF